MTAGVIVLLLVGGRRSFWSTKRANGDGTRSGSPCSLLGCSFSCKSRSDARSSVAEQAISSRYSTCSLLIMIGIYAILSNLSGKRLGRLIYGLWAFSLALARPDSSRPTVNGYQLGRSIQRKCRLLCVRGVYERFAARYVLRHFRQTVRPPLTRRVIAFLREHRWNLFASSGT